MDSKASASTFFPDSPRSAISPSALHLDFTAQTFEYAAQEEPSEDSDRDCDPSALEAMLLLSLAPRIHSGAHVLVEKITHSKTTPIVTVLRLA